MTSVRMFTEVLDNRVLIADDDPTTCRMLSELLSGWGLRVVAVADGQSALTHLTATDGPRLALLDWTMPGLEGPEVCRATRSAPISTRPHLILLTARTSTTDVVSGLEAGADDYLTKPFDHDELRARVQAGLRIVGLQEKVDARLRELQSALERSSPLVGALPICAYCKAIRDDADGWQRVEDFFAARTDVTFSHGICPACLHDQMAGLQDHQQRPKETP